MSRPLVGEAVAVTMAPDQQQDAPRFVREKVRFGFHTIGITLTGILVLLMPMVTTKFFLFGTSFGQYEISLLLLGLGLVTFTWYEWIRNRPVWMKATQSWWLLPLWPLTYWNQWFVRSVQVRPHEQTTRTATLDFSLGFALVWVTCPTLITAAACFATAWADPLARVFGKRWGKTKWWFNNKTVFGSMTCLSVAALSVYLTIGLSTHFTTLLIGQALLVGLITMLCELIPQFPEDPKPGAMISPADNFWLVTGTALTLVLVV